MTAIDSEAQRLFAGSRTAAAKRDVVRAIELARRTIELEPNFPEALEHLGTLLVTRRQAYAEGLELVERATAVRLDDAGLWYALGWVREFAAHEIRRRRDRSDLDPKALYQQAADAFRRCLALKPEGKLVGDAEDLLDHIENELASL